MRAAGVIFFAYIGYDAVSTAAQEARRPQKDMPIGIIGSLAICTVLYVLFSIVLTGVVNYTELGGAAPVATAIDRTPYDWLKPLVKLAVICGFTSVILVMLLGQSRVFFSMSREGVLPKVFSDIPRPFKTPLVPLVPILGIVVCAAMMYSLGPDNWLRLIVWLIIGQVIYFTYSRFHSKMRRAGGRPRA